MVFKHFSTTNNSQYRAPKWKRDWTAIQGCINVASVCTIERASTLTRYSLIANTQRANNDRQQCNETAVVAVVFVVNVSRRKRKIRVETQIYTVCGLPCSSCDSISPSHTYRDMCYSFPSRNNVDNVRASRYSRIEIPIVQRHLPTTSIDRRTFSRSFCMRGSGFPVRGSLLWSQSWA